MRKQFNAPWFPSVLGVIAALLAIDGVRELLFVAPHQAQFHLLGYLVEGDIAWIAAAVHAGFLAWLAWACFTRRSQAVIGIFAYCVYWIVTVWIWSQLYGPGSAGTKILTCTLVTVTLLVVCRVAIANRASFDR
jgi:hypothetical protein